MRVRWRSRPLIRCWKWPRPRESRSSFPAATVGMGAWAPPSEHPVYPPTHPMRRPSVAHPSSTTSTGRATKRSDGAAVLSCSITRAFSIRRCAAALFRWERRRRESLLPQTLLASESSWDWPAGSRYLRVGRSLYWRPYRPDFARECRAYRLDGEGLAWQVPIFTALWAIANQHAGHSLGQAAPYIAGLKPGELVDVLPLSSVTNVTGTIYDSTGATFYSAASLFAGPDLH